MIGVRDDEFCEGAAENGIVDASAVVNFHGLTQHPRFDVDRLFIFSVCYVGAEGGH